MTRQLLSISIHVYGLAAVVYLTHLVRQAKALAITGRLLVGAGLSIHGAALLGQVVGQGGMPVGMSQGLSLFAFLLLAIFLAIDLIYRRAVIGAFVLPLALAVLLPAFVVPASDGTPAFPESVRGPLLPLHVSIA